jgi:hypothetical protein
VYDRARVKYKDQRIDWVSFYVGFWSLTFVGGVYIFTFRFFKRLESL